MLRKAVASKCYVGHRLLVDIIDIVFLLPNKGGAMVPGQFPANSLLIRVVRDVRRQSQPLLTGFKVKYKLGHISSVPPWWPKLGRCELYASHHPRLS